MEAALSIVNVLFLLNKLFQKEIIKRQATAES
jgi:hypothetical protein